jgi:hypothetical protein
MGELVLQALLGAPVRLLKRVRGVIHHRESLDPLTC